MSKRKNITIEVKGDLRFEGVDQRVAQFKAMPGDDGPVGNPAVDLPALSFPEDFDPQYDIVTGSYHYVVEITRKPFPKRGE